MTDGARRKRRLFIATGVVVAGCVGTAGWAQAGSTGRSAAPPAAQAAPTASAEVFVALAPQRVLDTRGPGNGPIGVPAAGPLLGGQQIDLPLTTPAPNRASAPLPANATSALINVTVDDDATLKSFLTVWPAETPRPFTSANNAEPGLVSPNLTMAKLGPTGGVSFYAQQGAINIAVDLVGYTVPLSSVGAGGGVPLITGSGAPIATTGNDGDVYLDLTTGSFYGPKTAGAWPPAVPTPPPTAVGQGADDVAIDLSTDALPAFGTAATVWTVTGLTGAGDHVLDAVVNLQPNAALTADAVVQCWWSTRPGRLFTTHLTAPGADDGLLHAQALAVPGTIVGADTADLVCQSASTSTIADAVAVTGVHVNIQHVSLTSNT